MNITMLKTAAGPNGVKLAGQTLEVPDQEAAAYIKDGAAKPAPAAPKPAAKPEPSPAEQEAALRADIEKAHAKELAALKDDAARKSFIDKKVAESKKK